MNARGIFRAAVGGLCLGLGCAGAAATVQDLAWMSGTWAGAVGPGELEENWTQPKAGSIQSLVRMTAGGKTNMVELIVIEEVPGDDGETTLRLHLQQWDPGYKPRPQGPTHMVLDEIGDNTVAFVPDGEGMFNKLRYTRDGENFTIGIETPDGNAMEIPLKMVRRDP